MSAPPDQRPPDLLVSGDDRPPRQWRVGRGRTWAVVAVVGVVTAASAAAGALVQADRAADERRRLAAVERSVVRLALLRPGEDGGPRYGPRRPGAHLFVGNEGPAPVRLLRGTLDPASWQVSVSTDRALRPGRTRRFELTPPLACGAPAPRELRVQVLPTSGRPATVVFDLTGARLAYGGTIADAAAAWALTCDPGPGAGGRPGALPAG